MGSWTSGHSGPRHSGGPSGRCAWRRSPPWCPLRRTILLPPGKRWGNLIFEYLQRFLVSWASLSQRAGHLEDYRMVYALSVELQPEGGGWQVPFLGKGRAAERRQTRAGCRSGTAFGGDLSGSGQVACMTAMRLACAQESALIACMPAIPETSRCLPRRSARCAPPRAAGPHTWASVPLGATTSGARNTTMPTLCTLTPTCHGCTG